MLALRVTYVGELGGYVRAAEWLKSGALTVRGDQREWPARLQIAPFYDPQRLRILAEPPPSPGPAP